MLKLLENGIYTNGKEYITGNYLKNTFKTEEEKEKYKQIEYYSVPDGTVIRYFDENGDEVDEDDDYVEEQAIDIFQYYLIDDSTARMLIGHTDEIIFYSEKLDLYVLGVTHFGTMWCGVGTDFTK